MSLKLVRLRLVEVCWGHARVRFPAAYSCLHAGLPPSSSEEDSDADVGEAATAIAISAAVAVATLPLPEGGAARVDTPTSTSLEPADDAGEVTAVTGSSGDASITITRELFAKWETDTSAVAEELLVAVESDA